MVWPIIKKISAKIGINFTTEKSVGNGSVMMSGKNNTANNANVNVFLAPAPQIASKLDQLIEKTYQFIEENSVRGSQSCTLSEIYEGVQGAAKEDVFKAVNMLINRRKIKEVTMGCDDQTRSFWAY